MAIINILAVGKGGNGAATSTTLTGKGGGSGGVVVDTTAEMLASGTYVVAMGAGASTLTAPDTTVLATASDGTNGSLTTGGDNGTAYGDGGAGADTSAAITGQNGYVSSISGSAVTYGSGGGGGASPTYPTEAAGGTNAGSGGEVAHNLILDLVTGAKVAYSAARKLRTGVTQAFRAARGNSSNVAEQNIGFSGNAVDETALTTFISTSTNAKIVTWYDQTGGAEHAVAADTWTFAGAIYRSGLIKEGGKLTNRFKIDGTDVYYLPTIDSEFASPGSEYTVFMVGKPLNNTAQIAGTGSGNGGANTVFRMGTTTHFIGDAAGTDVTSSGVSALSYYTAYKRSGDREIRINGVSQSTTTSSSTRNTGINRIGGSPFFGAPNHHDGFISEIIIYERALTDAEIHLVENSIKGFYGL